MPSMWLTNNSPYAVWHHIQGKIYKLEPGEGREFELEREWDEYDEAEYQQFQDAFEMFLESKQQTERSVELGNYTVSIGVTNESGRDIEKGEVIEVDGKTVKEALAHPALKSVSSMVISRDIRGIKPIGGWPECAHDWQDVGFRHSKWVCSKCNVERP